MFFVVIQKVLDFVTECHFIMSIIPQGIFL